jgi:hypothetical protein
MPSPVRTVLVLLTCGFLAAAVPEPARAARIEANPGKRYELTSRHGPWMIMVANFHTTADDGITKEGKSPEQAADDLVLELRQRGIPAYVYEIVPESESFTTQDAYGRPVRRKNLRRVKSVGVLAGNYSGVDEHTAQSTLKWIKEYDPRCLKEGVVFVPRKDVRTPSGERQTPLSAAFLTINPMLNPQEVASRNIDPLLLRLNHRERYSLLENKGKMTLIVASFAGKVKAVSDHSGSGLREEQDSGGLTSFLKDNDLDDAAQQARALALALRQTEHVDAYVWHDRYESYVTVGAFSSENDPGIAAMRARFGSAQPMHLLGPTQIVANKSSGLKYLAVDSDGRKVDLENTALSGLTSNYQLWAFDPNPRTMHVPRAR